ncbi:MAG TPA: hypothetical protein H9684_07215 [Firmicutes bacterium]|nr:hypothetical protein [Bacillota bacterium]
MSRRLCGAIGGTWHLLFLLAGGYLASAILIPSIGGAFHCGAHNWTLSSWQDGAFWLTAAVAAASLLFFLLALVNGIRMLCRVARSEPLGRREFVSAAAGTLGCLLPSLMIPDATLARYPMMQPKWPPLPKAVERHICLEGSACFSLFFLFFGLSLAGCLIVYLGYDRRAVWAQRKAERPEK